MLCGRRPQSPPLHLNGGSASQEATRDIRQMLRRNCPRHLGPRQLLPARVRHLAGFHDVSPDFQGVDSVKLTSVDFLL